MQIKIKNRWKIIVSLFLVLLFGVIGSKEALMADLPAGSECDDWAANPDCMKCEYKHLRGETGERVYGCQKSDGWYCAYFTYSGVDYGTCRKVDSNRNQCAPAGTGNCQKCDFMQRMYMRAFEDEQLGDQSVPVRFDTNAVVGCLENSSCQSDVNSTHMICLENASACGQGRGVYQERDGTINPRICQEANKPCNHKMEDDELYIFLAAKAIDVTRGNDWPGEKNLHIEAGDKAYCSKFGNEIDFDTCALRSDKDLQHKTDKDTLPFISNVYNDQDQVKIKDAFRPNYECKGEGVSGWLKRLGWGLFNSTIGTAVALVVGIVLSFVTFIMGFLLWTVTALLEWAIGISQMDMGIVDVVWKFLRDFSNMFFIIILLYIAFCTVLSIQSQNLKKLLPGFLVGAILINFSKLLCQLVIDFAQVLIDGFYNLRPLGTWGIITHLLRAGGIDRGFGVADLIGKTEMKDLMGVIGSQGLMVLYMFAAILTFGVAAILLVIRIITLWILTAISPLVYVAMAVGQSRLVKKYWTYFLRTALFAPALIFCILLSLVVLSHDIDSGEHLESRAGLAEDILKESITEEKIQVMVGSFPRFIQMVFALAFVWAGIFVAKKSGVMGSAAIVGAAEKGFKKAAPWITGAKPAGYGLRALGRYGWERALRSPRLGGKLKWMSPKVWKEAYKRHREKAELETYPQRVAGLQSRISGWTGFFHKRGPAYDKEKFLADAMALRDIKRFRSQIAEADRPTEDIYTSFIDRNLDIARKRGRLGSESAFTPDLAGGLLVATDRGDTNDVLKTSKYGMEIAGGRAVMGADVKYYKRLFGSSPWITQFANIIGEASKGRYYQFAYPTGVDERGSLDTVDDDEELRKIELDEAAGEGPSRELRFSIDFNVFQKYIRQKANKLGVSFEQLYDLAIENLGQTRERILAQDEKGSTIERFEEIRGGALKDIGRRKAEGKIGEGVDDETLLKGVASVVETYNVNRGNVVRSEIQKKGPSLKWRAHIGSLLGDVNKISWTEGERKRYEEETPAPATVKYFGLTPSSRAFIESTTDADARRIQSWADPRLIQALQYAPNRDDLVELARKIDEDNAKDGKETEFERIWIDLLDRIGAYKKGGKPEPQGPVAQAPERPPEPTPEEGDRAEEEEEAVAAQEEAQREAEAEESEEEST